jgi:5-(carboxyamino)imidazole ribonucleotide mutase
MTKPFVAILMGSKNDWDIMKPAQELLNSFDIANEARVLSAHRVPEALETYVRDAESRGCFFFI